MKFKYVVVYENISDKFDNGYGRQKPSKGGGDLSREVWHNKKGLWYKNNKKNKRAEEAKSL